MRWHWAAELSRGSATAIALGKSIMNQSFELPADRCSRKAAAQGICYTSSAHRESVLAFLAVTAQAGMQPAAARTASEG